MKNEVLVKWGGFTLIELLVVVLIIGILAAVAIPQYQKAVWRSRNANLKAMLKTVRQAEDAYYMANGSYAGNFDELAIDLPLTAPNMGTQTHEDICNYGIQGADSVRRGKDFQIVLNATDLTQGAHILAHWTSGPYQCHGFMMSASGKMLCLEKDSATREFCEKIEKGINRTVKGSTVYWDLP